MFQIKRFLVVVVGGLCLLLAYIFGRLTATSRCDTAATTEVPTTVRPTLRTTTFTTTTTTQTTTTTTLGKFPPYFGCKRGQDMYYGSLSRFQKLCCGIDQIDRPCQWVGRIII